MKKRLAISVIFFHLLLQLALTFLSSLHWFLLLLSFIGYTILLIKEYYRPNNSVLFCNHYLSSIIFTIIHFIFVLAYNKILPWEIGLVILFALLILNYARGLGLSIFRWDLAWWVRFIPSFLLFLAWIHIVYLSVINENMIQPRL